MTAGPVIKPLSQCGLCSRLPDSDYSFSKYGWPDHDVSMSPDSIQLMDVDKESPGTTTVIICFSARNAERIISTIIPMNIS